MQNTLGTFKASVPWCLLVPREVKSQQLSLRELLVMSIANKYSASRREVLQTVCSAAAALDASRPSSRNFL